MAERLDVFAIGDIGGSKSRTQLWTPEGAPIGDVTVEPTLPDNYDGSIESIIRRLGIAAGDRYRIISGSIAIAATPEEGELKQSGELTPWLGRRPADDIAHGLDLERGRVGVLNDVVAIARSQHDWNESFRRPGEEPDDSVVATWSTGWNDALIFRDGTLVGREDGHHVLELEDEHSAVCTCGSINHIEGFVSGNGVEKNTGTKMAEWLKDPENTYMLASLMSLAVIQTLERNKGEFPGFSPREMAWTGSVAINNPNVLGLVADKVWDELGPENSPRFTMAFHGEQAGVNGAYRDALERAEAA